jgi:hypothetical protein
MPIFSLPDNKIKSLVFGLLLLYPILKEPPAGFEPATLRLKVPCAKTGLRQGGWMVSFYV